MACCNRAFVKKKVCGVDMLILFDYFPNRVGAFLILNDKYQTYFIFTVSGYRYSNGITAIAKESKEDQRVSPTLCCSVCATVTLNVTTDSSCVAWGSGLVLYTCAFEGL